MVSLVVVHRTGDCGKAFQAGSYQECVDAAVDADAVVVEVGDDDSDRLPNSHRGRRGYQHLRHQTNRDVEDLYLELIVRRRCQQF